MLTFQVQDIAGCLLTTLVVLFNQLQNIKRIIKPILQDCYELKEMMR